MEGAVNRAKVALLHCTLVIETLPLKRRRQFLKGPLKSELMYLSVLANRYVPVYIVSHVY
jgi:hypothetical protein